MLDIAKSVLLRGSFGKGVGVSAILHFGAFVVLAQTWLAESPQRAEFAGSRQVIAIELSFAEPTPPTVLELPVVEIQPGLARIAERRFVDVPASLTEWDLSEVEPPPSAIETAPPRKSPPIEEEPEVVEVDPSRLARTEQQSPPPIAVAVPEVLGTADKTPPKFFSNRPPRYPELAAQRGWQGKVILRITIDVEGRVSDVDVHRSSGYEILDAAAVRAVRTWSGEPARVDGRPVETVELLPVVFRR